MNVKIKTSLKFLLIPIENNFQKHALPLNFQADSVKVCLRLKFSIHPSSNKESSTDALSLPIIGCVVCPWSSFFFDGQRTRSTFQGQISKETFEEVSVRLQWDCHGIIQLPLCLLTTYEIYENL